MNFVRDGIKKPRKISCSRSVNELLLLLVFPKTSVALLILNRIDTISKPYRKKAIGVLLVLNIDFMSVTLASIALLYNPPHITRSLMNGNCKTTGQPLSSRKARIHNGQLTI